MTLEELKKERARIDKEIEKLTGLNFTVGKAKIVHYTERYHPRFSVHLQFTDSVGRSSFKEVFRYSPDANESISKSADKISDGIDEIVYDLVNLQKELLERAKICG